MDPMQMFARPESAPQVAPARPLAEIWKERARAKQQQEKSGVMLELPSGAPVRVLRVPLVLLLQRGRIPDALTPIVQRYIKEIKDIEKGEEPPEEKREAEMALVKADVDNNEVEAYNNFLTILDFVVQTAVIEPRFCRREDAHAFVPTPDQPEPLFLDWGLQGEPPDIDDADKLFVYQFCQGVDQTVEEFFRRQANALGVLPDRQDVPLSTEGTVRADELNRHLVGLPDRPGSVDVGQLHRRQNPRDEGSSPQTQARQEHGDRAEIQPVADQPDAGADPAGRKPGRRPRSDRGPRNSRPS